MKEDARLVKFINRISDYIYDKLYAIRKKFQGFNFENLIKLIFKIIIFFLVFAIIKVFVPMFTVGGEIIIRNVGTILRGFLVNTWEIIVNYFYYVFYVFSLYALFKYIIESDKDYKIFKKEKYNENSYLVFSKITLFLKALAKIMIIPIFIFFIFNVSMFFFTIFLIFKKVFILSLIITFLLLSIASFLMYHSLSLFLKENHENNFMLSSLIVFVLTIISVSLFFFETRNYKIDENLNKFYKLNIRENTYNLNTNDYKMLDIKTEGKAKIHIDNNMEDGIILIKYSNYETSSVNEESNIKDEKLKLNIRYRMDLDKDESLKIFKLLYDSLRNKKFYDYSSLKYGKIDIYLSENTKEKIKVREVK